MSETETAHCRLCAQLKPYAKLVTLKTDEERKKVEDKLSRLALEVNLNSPHDVLPRTVCFPCVAALNNAFEFVLNVEASQGALRELGLGEVKEEVINDDDNCHEEECTKPMVKLEIEIHEHDLDIRTRENITINDPGINEHKSEITDDCRIKKPESELKKYIKQEKFKENSATEETKNDSSYSYKISLVESHSWKDYSWLCAYCDVMFSSIDELKEHAIQSHGCCNPYRCTDCKVRRLTLDNFVKHVKRHRSNFKLSCYRCHKTFRRQYDVICHNKEHRSTEFYCPGCNETFATNEQCLEHCNKYNKDKKIREVPPEHITDDLKCVFCHKQFKYKGVLTTHLLTQHREQKRDHTCDKCGKCFLNKANLAGHMLMHDDIRPYECDICKHCFRQRSQLSRHMGTHDGKKPFDCDKCGRCFRLKKQLSTHSIVHTEECPYICSYCKKGFKHKSTFIQHERLHTGERPYKCHVCDSDFTNWPNYNKHMKRRHGLNMAKSQQSSDVPTTTKLLDIEVPGDLTIQNKNNFVPKHRGRPKLIKSVQKKILCKEIKTFHEVSHN